MCKEDKISLFKNLLASELKWDPRGTILLRECSPSELASSGKQIVVCLNYINWTTLLNGSHFFLSLFS